MRISAWSAAGSAQWGNSLGDSGIPRIYNADPSFRHHSSRAQKPRRRSPTVLTTSFHLLLRVCTHPETSRAPAHIARSRPPTNRQQQPRGCRTGRRSPHLYSLLPPPPPPPPNNDDARPMPPFQSSLATARGWVDPLALPKYGDAADVAGNAPADAKQLTLNTLGSYGVGDADCFAYAVGRQIRIAEMNAERKGDKAEVVVVSEVQVIKEMLNGAGLVHGGCLCYLIDNCAAFPLVALGVMQKTNGVGVTQALNIFFHAPASLQTCMRITSTSVTLGGRIMTSRCEITDKASGRMIASALLGKMQPKL